jgi:hypothetical protein
LWPHILLRQQFTAKADARKGRIVTTRTRGYRIRWSIPEVGLSKWPGTDRKGTSAESDVVDRLMVTAESLGVALLSRGA